MIVHLLGPYLDQVLNLRLQPLAEFSEQPEWLPHIINWLVGQLKCGVLRDLSTPNLGDPQQPMFQLLNFLSDEDELPDPMF